MTPEFKPGAEPGLTDVTLHAADRFPLQPSVGYRNAGAPASGYDRWDLGLTYVNAVFRLFTLSYTLTSGDDFWLHRQVTDGVEAAPEFFSHQASLRLPLLSSLPAMDGAVLMVSGSYTQQSPHLVRRSARSA